MSFHQRLRNNRTIMNREILSLKTARRSQLEACKAYIQHGHTSVYQHCLSVSYMCCLIAAFLPFRIHVAQMVRGAMLHDYFLYDWHQKDKSHRLHGFTHPARALQNADRDFHLTDIEKEMIRKHMFPLTPIPPLCREAWILCIADKICSTQETFQRFL